MTGYPTGITVGQNQQVPPQYWTFFNTPANLNTFLPTITAVTTTSPGTTTSMYIYNPDQVFNIPASPTVVPYRYDCYGSDSKGTFFCQEMVAELLDRQTVPNPAKNDMYVAGQGSPVLKAKRDSPTFGHLYWTYASNPAPQFEQEATPGVEPKPVGTPEEIEAEAAAIEAQREEDKRKAEEVQSTQEQEQEQEQSIQDKWNNLQKQ